MQNMSFIDLEGNMIIFSLTHREAEQLDGNIVKEMSAETLYISNINF